MVKVSWWSISKIHFSELYPDLYKFYTSGELPQKSKTAIARFLVHTKTFTWDAEQKKIFLIADNLPDNALKGIVQLPVTLEVINPNEEELENIIAEMYSNIMIGGFRGVDPLYKNFRQSYLGVTRDDISNVLEKIKLKQYSRIPEHRPLQPIITSKVLETIQIDLIEVKDKNSNDKIEYLLSIINMFSKFAWSIPLKNKSCAVVADKLQCLLLVEGFPDNIQSDNRGEFIGQEMVDFTTRWNIKMKHSLPYHSQAQGCVEKFNSTTRNLIHNYQVDSGSKRYIHQLPFLIYSYNTTKHSTTHFTPFEVFRKKNEAFPLDAIVAKHIKKNAETMRKKVEKGKSLDLPQVAELVSHNDNETDKTLAKYRLILEPGRTFLERSYFVLKPTS